MYKQTLDLSRSLPNFANDIEAADEKGSSDWEIVRWENVPPSQVNSEHLRVLADDQVRDEADKNCFPSRTPALRVSEKILRQFKDIRTEKAHWGVWRWNEHGKTYYQTALPVNRGRMRVAPSPPSMGQNTTVRLSEQAYEQVRLWAKEDGVTLQASLETALREYDRQRFFAKANAAYKTLRSDPEAWAEVIDERKELEGTLLDNLEKEDISTELSTATTVKQERKSA